MLDNGPGCLTVAVQSSRMRLPTFARSSAASGKWLALRIAAENITGVKAIHGGRLYLDRAGRAKDFFSVAQYLFSR